MSIHYHQNCVVLDKDHLQDITRRAERAETKAANYFEAVRNNTKTDTLECALEITTLNAQMEEKLQQHKSKIESLRQELENAQKLKEAYKEANSKLEQKVRDLHNALA